VACVAAVGGCGAQETLLGTRGSHLFTAMDVLANPGERTALRAQLRGGDLLRGRPGCIVRFYRDGRLFKVAETDADGLAVVSFTPPAPGDTLFTVAVAPIGLADEPPDPVTLRVACRPRQAPLAVVDLDRTLVATGFDTVLVGTPQPMEGSQAVLARLARTQTIVYLTHRPDYFSLKSKAWLAEHEYPPGPLLLSTLGGFLKGSGAFKSDAIEALSKRFSKIEIGIGDKISDAQAYHIHGLRAFLILPRAPAETPEAMEALADELGSLDDRVQVVENWRQVEEALFGKGAYPRSARQRRMKERAKTARARATTTRPVQK